MASPTKDPSSSFPGSFVIRAPLTVDDDDDDVESYKTDYSDEASSSIYNVSESDEFGSGEDYESASEKLFIADPDEGSHKLTSFFDKFENPRPFVSNPGEKSSESSPVDDEESSAVTNAYSPLIDSDSPNLVRVMPVAQLSMDDDEFHESLWEDSTFLGSVKVPSFGDVSRVDNVPKIRLSDIEDDKKVGLVTLVDSSVVNSQLFELKDDVVLSNEDDKGFSNDSVPAGRDGQTVRSMGNDLLHCGDIMRKERVSVLVNSCEVTRESEPHQVDTNSFDNRNELNVDSENIEVQKGLCSGEDIEDLLFEVSGMDRLVMNELTRSPSSSHQEADDLDDDSRRNEELILPHSDEELKTDKKHEQKKLFNPSAFSALLKAVAAANLDGGKNTVFPANGSKVFSTEKTAGSGASFSPSSFLAQSNTVENVVNDNNMSEEEKKVIEKIEQIRVEFLRLVHRLRLPFEDSIVAQVLHRVVLEAGIHVPQRFSDEFSQRMAVQLEAEGKDKLDFCLNILVIGKSGVGKSATVNSIFGGKKALTNAFEPCTTKVKEIVETINGMTIRVLDSPGLRTFLKEEATNRKILASIKKLTKKFPPDVVLYVDRLDSHGEDFSDLRLLASITNTLTTSIWRNAIVILTHAAAPPPETLSGSPLSFEMFVAQRSRVVQLAISQAVGDIRLLHPSIMHPVSLVENHSACQKNERGENILPNGQVWRTQLLLLCYSLKILSKGSSKTKPEYHLYKLPLPNLVSSLLQPRRHPLLDGDNVDSDVDLLVFSDSDEDDYDQLPPFKPLKKSQVDKLSKGQRKAYFDDYDFRVKLFQKKQWREEVKRLKALKEGTDCRSNHGYTEEDVKQEDGGPAIVQVPMPDHILPHSFDSDGPSYRYRSLESASQLIVRPVLESHGWDHDIGYDAIGIERNLVIAGRFPGAFSVQIMKDKKEFSIHLDSSICAKHGENGLTMAGFDIQAIGRQLAYILRSETKVKNLKLNKTAAGLCITLLGKNVATGLKIEDQIAIGKRLSLVGSAGAVSTGEDRAYGANFEIRIKDKDFPVRQDQSSMSFSLMKWRREMGLMANLASQFSIGQSSKITIQVGMNNRQNGQITMKASGSELQVAFISIVPMIISMLMNVCNGRNK